MNKNKVAVVTTGIFILIILVSTTYNPIVAKSSKSNSSNNSNSNSDVAKYDIQKNCAADQHTILTPLTYLTHFSCGHVSQLDNGTTLRKFTMIVHEDIKTPLTLGNLETNTKPIMYDAWTFNGSIPAPTIRVTKGDIVSINVINLATNKFPHSMHMHSIHAGNIDGTMFNNESGTITPGHNFTYTFTADPVGLWPFHCHQMPLALHMVKGLYGQMIIDPPASEARPIMTELNMIMNGYDIGLTPQTELPRLPTFAEAQQIMKGNDTMNEALPQERDNQIYSLNGVAFYYDANPIPIQMGQPYRVYLTNFLDFDFANTFHLHGNVFKYYPSGTDTKTPMETTDIVSLAQGDRGIMEFQYDKPGLYMIHSHFESQSGRGWEGLFKVANFNSGVTTTKTTSINSITNQIETHTDVKPIEPPMMPKSN